MIIVAPRRRVQLRDPFSGRLPMDQEADVRQRLHRPVGSSGWKPPKHVRQIAEVSIAAVVAVIVTAGFRTGPSSGSPTDCGARASASLLCERQPCVESILYARRDLPDARSAAGSSRRTVANDLTAASNWRLAWLCRLSQRLTVPWLAVVSETTMTKAVGPPVARTPHQPATGAFQPARLAPIMEAVGASDQRRQGCTHEDRRSPFRRNEPDVG